MIACKRKISAKIISRDSLFISKGVDVGTDEPSDDEFEMVGNNALNLVTLDNDFDVAMYIDWRQIVCYVVLFDKFLLNVIVGILRG